MQTITELSSKISVPDFLENINKVECDDSLKIIMKLFGGRLLVVNTILSYFTNQDTYPVLEERYDLIGRIIFDLSDSRTYLEDWEYFNEKFIEVIPDNILLNWLLDYKPGSHKSEAEDVALDWLVNNSFGGKITIENFPILKALFQITDCPKELYKFEKRVHFIDELKLFEDLSFIENSYTNFDFNKEEILEILKGIIIARKLTDFRHIEIFIRLVKWYAPTKSILDSHKYKAFVLEVFEADDDSGVEMFSTNTFQIIQEYFYDINFMDSADEHKQLYQIKIEDEANHISRMQSKYPNYRHD